MKTTFIFLLTIIAFVSSHHNTASAQSIPPMQDEIFEYENFGFSMYEGWKQQHITSTPDNEEYWNSHWILFTSEEDNTYKSHFDVVYTTRDADFTVTPAYLVRITFHQFFQAKVDPPEYRKSSDNRGSGIESEYAPFLGYEGWYEVYNSKTQGKNIVVLSHKIIVEETNHTRIYSIRQTIPVSHYNNEKHLFKQFRDSFFVLDEKVKEGEEISEKNSSDQEDQISDDSENENDQRSFSDVREGYIYHNAIVDIANRGIVSGYPDQTYRPNRSINRAEFTKIIVGASEMLPSGSHCFPDVKDEWFAGYVCTAKDNDILGGYPDGTFQPTNNIIVAEALKIVLNAFDIEVEENANTEWYVPYVRFAQRNGLYLDSFRPEKHLTRGEMAELIVRTYAYVSTTE